MFDLDPIRDVIVFLSHKRNCSPFLNAFLDPQKGHGYVLREHVDPAVPLNPQRKPSSQESRMATRNMGPIVNSSETLSLGPFPGFEQGGPTASCNVAFPSAV